VQIYMNILYTSYSIRNEQVNCYVHKMGGGKIQGELQIIYLF